MMFTTSRNSDRNHIYRELDQFAKNIALKKFDIVSLKEIFLTFLLFLNEDFDDDLLQDAIQLLVEE